VCIVYERERERESESGQRQTWSSCCLPPSPPPSEQLRRARCPSCLLPDRLLTVQAAGPIAPVFWRSRATPISPAPHQPSARSRVKLATSASGDCEQLGSCSNTIHDQFHALHDLHRPCSIKLLPATTSDTCKLFEVMPISVCVFCQCERCEKLEIAQASMAAPR
jgi:hypothetical protein